MTAKIGLMRSRGSWILLGYDLHDRINRSLTWRWIIKLVKKYVMVWIGKTCWQIFRKIFYQFLPVFWRDI